MRRNALKQKLNDEAFAQAASELGLIQSGISNNDDYTFFYDAFTLSGDNPVWQTTSKPRIYVNPNRRRGAELLVKGNYNLPVIKLDAKHNKTHIHHRWGNPVPITRTTLEGNFNKFFTLYSESGQELIALQIISPNIMQDMIDTQLYFDVQIQGAAIMITTDAKEWSADFLQELIDHVVTLDSLVRATQKVTHPRIGSE